uniref:Uncharacterized protein n=1 Tax=Ralstonia solanacearum TaxID=305 RepID=A0A0S4U061_RALSL|nr:protein of unknown function [Ralstonia solanacearum]
MLDKGRQNQLALFGQFRTLSNAFAQTFECLHAAS